MTAALNCPPWCFSCTPSPVEVTHLEGAVTPFVPTFDTRAWITVDRHRLDQLHDGHQVRFVGDALLSIETGQAELTARDLVRLGGYLVALGEGLLAEPHDAELVPGGAA